MLFRDFKYKHLFVYFLFKYMLWTYVFFLAKDIIRDKNLWYFHDVCHIALIRPLLYANIHIFFAHVLDINLMQWITGYPFLSKDRL